MEKIEKILEFLKIESLEKYDGYGYGSGSGSGSGSGDGYGYGSGSGYGSGYGYGSGDGYGYGYGSGSGSGDGYGSGYGSGSGYGYGSGSGSGSGSGDGYGYGSGSGEKIIKINGDLVFYVDGIPTIFSHIHKNIAKGYMLDETDYSLTNCYIVKNKGFFAHGETIKQALLDLEEKFYSDMDIETKISEFKKKFNNVDKYSGNEFFIWHHILTGSCLAGRNYFIKSHNCDLNKTYSVKEFIKICENDYGGSIIKKLKEFYY